jgi:hypothetical protein
MKTIGPDTKICPSCDASFICTGGEDCWCEKVRINKKEMLIIMQKYNDCLCPDCLKKYEEGQGTRDEGQYEIGK